MRTLRGTWGGVGGLHSEGRGVGGGGGCRRDMR